MRGFARRDAGRQNDLVKVLRHQIGGRNACVQPEFHAGPLNALAEVTQGFRELLLARYASGQVELTADLLGRIEQRHIMAAFGQRGGGCQSGGAGANHRNAFFGPGNGDDEL